MTSYLETLCCLLFSFPHSRHDMIACLGETTGGPALESIRQQMRNCEEGRQILADKPRINTRTVDMDALRKLPENTFGFHYVAFLEKHVSIIMLAVILPWYIFGHCEITKKKHISTVYGPIFKTGQSKLPVMYLFFWEFLQGIFSKFVLQKILLKFLKEFILRFFLKFLLVFPLPFLQRFLKNLFFFMYLFRDSCKR